MSPKKCRENKDMWNRESGVRIVEYKGELYYEYAAWLDIDKICFSQNTIGGVFRDGKTIEDTRAEIILAGSNPFVVPPIRVYKDQVSMKYITHDNRRLYVLKLAGITRVPVIMTDRKVELRKVTLPRFDEKYWPIVRRWYN